MQKAFEAAQVYSIYSVLVEEKGNLKPIELGPVELVQHQIKPFLEEGRRVFASDMKMPEIGKPVIHREVAFVTDTNAWYFTEELLGAIALIQTDLEAGAAAIEALSVGLGVDSYTFQGSVRPIWIPEREDYRYAEDAPTVLAKVTLPAKVDGGETEVTVLYITEK